jgi:hypothetical protein
MGGPITGTPLEILVDAVTLVVVTLGIYFASRQEPTQYRDAKPLLVLSWSVFLGVVVVQLAGDLYTTVNLARIYTLISVPLILTDVAVLSILSYVIYARQSEPDISDRIRAMLKPRNRTSGVLLSAFTAYLASLVVYVLLAQPFAIVALPDLFGAQTYSTLFNPSAVPLLLLVLVGFLGYACGHLLLAAGRLASRATARALRIFALGWVVTGVSLFFFVGYSVDLGVDATALGFFIVAISFGAAVNVFRRESSLGGFFESMKSVVPDTHPFAGRVAARNPSFQGGGMMLLEVSPESSYDEVVRDFASEQVSNGNSLFVFTSRAKPIYKTLQQVPQTRFFIMTSEVSYPKPASELEVLIPQDNEAVLLSIIDRTLTANPESRMSFVFDSVSDLLLSSGLERTYKFLKQVLEMTSDPRITGLFLAVGHAHDERAMNFVKSLFATHLAFDDSGLEVTRHS